MFAEAFRDQQPMQEATLIRMSSSLPAASGRSLRAWDGDLAFAQRDGHPIGLRRDIEAGADVADAAKERLASWATVALRRG